MSELWKPSDTVFKPVETANRLNKMADDIESAAAGGGIFTIGNDGRNLDKTWQEIFDAMKANMICVCFQNDVDASVIMEIVTNASTEDDKYIITTNESEFATTDANGYPESRTD